MFRRLAPSQRNAFEPKRDVLAFGMWNIIEERISHECIGLLMTKIVFNSSETFSLKKSNLVNEKISLTFNNFNSEKSEPVCSVNSE